MITAINTSSTAVGSNDDSQDQHKKILTLWTQDFIACQPLAPFFHIATLGSLERSGEHIIALTVRKRNPPTSQNTHWSRKDRIRFCLP
jgi:hypothetical protein